MLKNPTRVTFNITNGHKLDKTEKRYHQNYSVSQKNVNNFEKE